MASNNLMRRAYWRVLFVSQTARTETPYLDPSVRYRCYNPAEVFEDAGILADVVAQQKLTVEMTNNYDAFVFHRPYGGDPNLVTCLNAIRKRGAVAVADYDDLIFSPEYALESSIFLNGIRDEKQTRGVFGNNYLGFTLFDSFTVSTEPLRKHVLALKGDAHVKVIRNGLSKRMVSSFVSQPSVAVYTGQIKIISYLSGTASHDNDFKYVAEVLASFLAEHEDFRLMVAGPLAMSEKFPSECVIRMPHREYYRFFTSIGNAYLNIAPLMPGNNFNACKSGLKFFESGIWGVPSVVSPLEDFCRFDDSQGISIENNTDGWYEALNNFADMEFRRQATEGLVSYCIEKCMATKSSMELLEFLKGDGL